MPVKKFQADLKAASTPGRYANIQRVSVGDYESSFSLTLYEFKLGKAIEIEVVISDTSDYPKSHDFVIFAPSGDLSPSIAKLLDLANKDRCFHGVSIHDTLTRLDAMVCRTLQTPEYNDARNIHADSPPFDDELNISNDGINEKAFEREQRHQKSLCRQRFKYGSQTCHKLCRDLWLGKSAGFQNVCLEETTGDITVMISCPISRLGLSDQALQAWELQSSQYLVLMMHYPERYQDIGDIFGLSNATGSSVRIRIGLSDSENLDLPRSAHFTCHQHLPYQYEKNAKLSGPEEYPTSQIRPLFIGKQLEELLNDRLLEILKIRQRMGISWTGAEFFFQASQKGKVPPSDAQDPNFFLSDEWSHSAPAILNRDHFIESGFGEIKSQEQLDMSDIKTSFPLVAFQFLLRHLARCNEFCLVCHCKTFESFEALKPLVCSNQLCIYQYIAYGMGPSIEHEICSQPLVVDLLVSLVYARAKSDRLEDFPTGLGIQIPRCLIEIYHGTLNMPRVATENLTSETNRSGNPGAGTVLGAFPGRLEISSMTLFCDATQLTVGAWLVIFTSDENSSLPNFHHCRIEKRDETLHSVIISAPIFANSPLLSSLETVSYEIDVTFTPYDDNFDHLDNTSKRLTMIALLDTLPNVDSMRSYLGCSGSGRLLSLWSERISPAALRILRWIISSCRSCILEDKEDSNHLVTPMQDFVQFRLLQGSSDREGRFERAVNISSTARGSSSPTLFAWHGSPVHNWQSISKEGLHYKDVAHGRSRGNGVYLSTDFATSERYGRVSSLDAAKLNWPHSTLNIRSVVSLNEVVNSPESFVSTIPHLVVQNLDWIQLRYIFVSSNQSTQSRPNRCNVAEGPSSLSHLQDSAYRPFGPNGLPVSIPLSGLGSERRISS